ncbi:MAG: prepilin peptidase [Ruminococcus sp.]|nr:prepilin peptidase [Candidatus Copronaster equi]
MNYAVVIKTIVGLIIAYGIVRMIPFLLLVGFISVIILRNSPKYRKGAKLNKWCVGITEIVTAVLIIRYGISFAMIKGVLLMLIFLFSSASDIRTRSLNNAMSVMVMLVGFINISPQAVILNLFAGVIAFVFMLCCGVISKNTIGGADIKFIPACFFVLGMSKGIIGLMTGLTCAIIGTLIRNKIIKIDDPKEKQKLALVPYLCIGFMSAYMI